MFNDLLVRKNYGALKQWIDLNAVKNIEFILIWAEHCAEECKLQWKYSYLLRIIKQKGGGI